MNDPVRTFINYLLDTETTSEISFNDDFLSKDILCQEKYLPHFEKLINDKLTQWNDVDRNDQRTTVGRLTTEDAVKVFDRESTKRTSSEIKNEEESDTETEPEESDGYDDIDHQCQRLLQFLYYCQEKHVHFIDLYFNTLERCIKSNNDKIIGVALQQVALHLSGINDNDNEHQRVIQCLPPDIFNSSKFEQYQSILSTIQALISTNKAERKAAILASLENLDVLYPYRARFQDARREFRDSMHYFIDGDSFILSIAHHKNVNINSYYGNTLHVIFIIERILLTLFNQSHQCNFTLVFFGSHHQLYQESSILNLIRAGLIAHLDKNSDKYGKNIVQQFSSWLDDDYSKFIHEEKPIFMFYHNMSNFNIENNKLLSKNAVQNLVRIYHLFGNYHQYVYACHLYLMNKLNLTDISVLCFQIEFKEKCPFKSLKEMVNVIFSDSSIMNIQNQSKKFDYDNDEDDDVRLFLYLKTIAEFVPEENEKDLFNLLSPMFVLHVALLIRLSLIDRHLPLGSSSITFSSRFSELILQFQNRLSSNLSACFSSLSWTKIADLFDGRLFAFTIYYIHRSSSNIRLDSITWDIVEQSFTVLNRQLNENIFRDAIEQMIEMKDIIFSSSSIEEQHTIVNAERQKIARVSNPFIDAYLQPILSPNNNLQFDLVDPEPKENSTVRYEGRHHWHTYQEVGSEIDRIRNNDEEKPTFYNHRFRTRVDQKFFEYSALYGKSLTSPDIKDNQLQIFLPPVTISITTDEEVDQAASTANNEKKPKHEGQRNKPFQPKKDLIIEKHRQEEQEKQIEDEANKVADIRNELKTYSNSDYSKAIDFIDQTLSQLKISDNRLKLLKEKFRLQRTYLRSLKMKQDLIPEEKSKLNLLQIECFAIMTEMVSLEKVVDAFDKKKKYMKELFDPLPLDHETWYRFQLEKINSRIPRREQGIPHKKEIGFIPDKWQKDFLDAVDERESIIIVAPTASGKTYASYYAMNEVLNDPDDLHGICVYIAPTKALVNQVAATIHSKITAEFGIFTRDFRRRVDSCRILITVPQCLEILLLSPKHQRWCQRIKYAIFDEIHCMSGESGSDVWEKIMLLINCPMIGLSATVNNGEELRQWIERVEIQRSELFRTNKPRKVRYISHSERLADLNKYLYTNRQLFPIHPVGIMNAKQLTTHGFPQDFSLSPCETLQLHDTMKKVLPDTSLPTLTEYFSPDWVIERSHCNEYSKLVRNRFNHLIQTKDNLNIDTITASLKPSIQNNQYPESKAISKLIVEFVLTLREENLLPCIVFTDSRKLCEIMAVSVTNYLEEHERYLRATVYKKQIEEIQEFERQIKNPRFKKKMKELEDSLTERLTKPNKNDDPAEIQRTLDEISQQTKLSGPQENLLYGVLEEAKLTSRHGYDAELVKKFLDRASSSQSKLARCMRRGVAYHHAGLNSRDRVAVEALYRNRCIQIVFSTSTLSLGIHMPTKTVGFIQDSIYLDALQYRQSSGRAGRRGFDIEGHVVFIDIPLAKIRHLMMSAIPNIHAHFPTSISFLMRLLQLFSNGKDPDDAKNRALVALQCPLILQSPDKYDLVNAQLRFHTLHTLDFLHRLNLINKRGDLVGLAGLASHLHYFEPANILLVFLMATKLFHTVTDDEEIVTILARLFTKELRLITQQKYKSLSEDRKKLKLNSMLFLPSISKEFQQRVEVYNTLVKIVYGGYIENVTKYLRSINKKHTKTLPFTKVSFSRQNLKYDNGSFEYQLHHHQSQQKQNPSISPFAGLSGLNHQDFLSNYNPNNGSWDLAYDLDLSPKIVPFADIDCCDHTNTAYYLDSYALDFYKHGSEKLLIKENELNPGNTHDLLLDFRFLLASIATSLEAIVKNKQIQETEEYKNFFLPLYETMSSIEEKFSDKFYKQYPSFKA